MSALGSNQGASGPQFVEGNDPRTLPLTRQQRALLDSTAPRVLLRAGNLTGMAFALTVACARAALEGKDALMLFPSFSGLHRARIRMFKRGWVVAKLSASDPDGYKLQARLRGPGGGTVSFYTTNWVRRLRPDGYDLIAVTFLPSEREWQAIDRLLRPGGRVLLATCTADARGGRDQPTRQRIGAGELVDLHFPLSEESMHLDDGRHLWKTRWELAPGWSLDEELQSPGAELVYRAEWPDQVSQ